MIALEPAPPGDELLDHPDADPSLVRESLRHLARANRWFGGWWAVRRGLTRLLAGVPRGTRVLLLDVGTGSGDLPLRAVRHWAARGVHLVAVGVERHPAAARAARGAGLPTVVADIAHLPFRPDSVDLVLASQVIHHFRRSATLAFFRAAGRVARRGVVIADLRRSGLALAAFRVGSALLRFDPATRADGLTSVRRGFTAGELQALLVEAGFEGRVELSPGFRLVASWRTAPR